MDDGAEGLVNDSGFSLALALNTYTDDDYIIDAFVDIRDLGRQDVQAIVNDIVDQVSREAGNICDTRVFDLAQSTLRQADVVKPTTLGRLLDALLSGFIAATREAMLDCDNVNVYRQHRETLERYAFLIQWFVYAADKNHKPEKEGNSHARHNGAQQTLWNSRPDWAWDARTISSMVGSLANILLSLNSMAMWTLTAERDSFIACFLKSMSLVTENEALMKNVPVAQGVRKILALAAARHGQAFSVRTTVMQNLQYHEHLPEAMADTVDELIKLEDANGADSSANAASDSIIRDVLSMQFSPQDTNGPKQFTRFLRRLAEQNPTCLMAHVPTLKLHLDADSFSIRLGMAEVFGHLVEAMGSSLQDINLDEALSEEGAARVAPENRQPLAMFSNLLDALLERFLDSSSYVRAKVVSMMTRLVHVHLNYNDLHLRLADLALRSLADRTTQVRKMCIILLTTLVQEHPWGQLYGGELSLEMWKARTNALQAELDALNLDGMASGDSAQKSPDAPDRPMDDANPESSEAIENDVDADVEQVNVDDGEATDPKPALNESQEVNEQEDSGANLSTGADIIEPALQRMNQALNYHLNALQFVDKITRASITITELLASTQKAEVIESLEFIRTAHMYRVEAAERGVKRMVHLIWARDDAVVEEDGRMLKGVKSKLVEVFAQMFFEHVPYLHTENDQTNRIVRNLIILTKQASLADLISLDELLGTLMATGHVQPAIVAKLWKIYAARSRELPGYQRRGAVLILAFFAASDPDLVAKNVDLLLNIGLGDMGRTDLLLAKYTCLALSRLAGKKGKSTGGAKASTSSTRFGNDHPIITSLMSVFDHIHYRYTWFALAEEAINTIYLLAITPDTLCAEILRDMTSRVYGQKAPDAIQMAQLLFVAGHVAIKQLAHIELIERELKKRRAEDEAQKQREKETNNTANTNDELDQVAGNAEDNIGDLITDTRENELLKSPQALLSLYGPLVVEIVTRPDKYTSATLQRAAVLALTKFMCISADFCDRHLMLLFHIFETSTEPTVRSNIVIALGDIAVCFVTIMDQNNDRLYAGLSDSDLTVKKNTLMVLTHLILNGMIKIKGQMGEMAKCLQDSDVRIADLAHLFFTELSTKDKLIYNNLPDVISHLSTGARAVDEKTFRSVIKFIFKFVEKRREVDGILDKLLSRFKNLSDVRHARDIAFCVSLLPLTTESSVKKLAEALPLYKDALHDSSVHKSFADIVHRVRMNKTLKNENDLKDVADALVRTGGGAAEDEEAGNENGDEDPRMADSAQDTETSGRRKHPRDDASSQPETGHVDHQDDRQAKRVRA